MCLPNITVYDQISQAFLLRIYILQRMEVGMVWKQGYIVAQSSKYSLAKQRLLGIDLQDELE